MIICKSNNAPKKFHLSKARIKHGTGESQENGPYAIHPEFLSFVVQNIQLVSLIDYQNEKNDSNDYKD